METTLDRLEGLFLLDKNEVDYIRKAWLYNEAAQSTSMDISIAENVAEAFAAIDEQRKEYVTDILITYSSNLCPTCSNILLFNADLHALYWCEVCKLGIDWKLNTVDGYIPEEDD